MGRSKVAPAYKPQAKTAHIKRVYPGELPPLPPSYEAAVAQRQSQQQQVSYTAVSYVPAMQLPIYNASAIPQPIYNNSGTGWDAWGAKLAEEVQHYGGRFFTANQPMDVVVPDNATHFFSSNPLGDIGGGCVDTMMLTPSSSVMSMDVDVDPFLMNVDDPDEMDVDYIIIAPTEVASVKEPEAPAVSIAVQSHTSSPWNFQQHQQQHQPQAQQQQQQQQPQRQQQQQQGKRPSPPVFVPARSMYTAASLNTPPPLPPGKPKPKVSPPKPKPKASSPKPQQKMSPPKVPERPTQTKVAPKPSSSFSATAERALTKDVERVIESFRRLHLSDSIIPPSKAPIDRNTIGASTQISTISQIQETPNEPTRELALVTFSCDDLISLGSPKLFMHSTPFGDVPPAFSGIWKDLAGLEKAFVPSPPLVDDSPVTVEQVSLPSSAVDVTTQYSDFLELRDMDWGLASTVIPRYHEQVSNAVEQRVSAATPERPKRKTPSNNLKIHVKNITRRYKTSKPKKALILGLSLNTLQQCRRKKKLTSPPANINKLKKRTTAKIIPCIVNVSIDKAPKRQPTKQSKGDQLIRKALANAKLHVPRRSTAVAVVAPRAAAIVDAVAPRAAVIADVVAPRAAVVVDVVAPKAIAVVDAIAPKVVFSVVPSTDTGLVSAFTIDARVQTPPPLSLSPVKEVSEVPRYAKFERSYTSFTTSFATAPSSHTIQESLDEYDEIESTTTALSPSSRCVEEARRTDERRYISYSCSFSIVPSMNNIKELAGPCNEEIPLVVPVEMADPLQDVEIEEKVFPGAFPTVENNARDNPQPSFLAWLSYKVFGW